MDRLRVLTINVWNRQGPWERRLALLRRNIAALAPDVIGLQEVLHHDGLGPNQAEEIAAGLGYETRYGGAWEVGGGLWFGNAVLSRFPIAASEVVPLPTAGEEGRSLLATTIDAPSGALPLFVTHLNWKLHHGAARVRQVVEIAGAVERLAPTSAGGFPPILVGDFNAEPASDEIRFLSGYHAVGGKSVYFADCHLVRGEGAGHTFVPRKNPYAAVTHEPDRRLDYVFVRGPDRRLRGEPLACRVVLDESDDGVWPSDHFGVLAEISIGS